MSQIIDGTWIRLSRGGFITDTSEGLIQVGCPPETIKDTITSYQEVPKIFILPKVFFNLEKYLSLVELEFPIYYNFFLFKKKTIIVCHKDFQKKFTELISNSFLVQLLTI